MWKWLKRLWFWLRPAKEYTVFDALDTTNPNYIETKQMELFCQEQDAELYKKVAS